VVSFQNRKNLLMSEINIIPFADIILVVLIVFIIAAPVFIESSVKIRLPQSRLNSPVAQNGDRITITVNEKGQMLINGTPTENTSTLANSLQNLEAKSKSLIIEADRNSNYGVVAEILGIAQDMGANNIQLLVQEKPGR
jgi:biopolymer transport protein ExbD